jgi:CDP-2,3-bis-(O-geranylgeranyl)-sn-glycerol synthase
MLNGKPLLGVNKTWRGLFFGVIFAIVVAYIQHRLTSAGYFTIYILYHYDSWLLFGILMGLGAILGDSVKSFFKRRISIAPGKSFVPFDQIDFVLGAGLFSMILVSLSFLEFIVILCLSFTLHILVNHIAFYLRIRKEKW